MDIIAHRGASGVHVENSMRAFTEALRCGTDGVEVDLRRSADGVIYCFHDHKLSRLTRSSGYFRRVGSKRIDDLRLADGSCIPRFTDFVKAYAGRTKVILDIKSARIEPMIIEQLAEFASDKGMVYSSFNPNNLKRIKNEFPAARTALIVGPVRNLRLRLKMKSVLTRNLLRLQCSAVHLSRRLVTENLVKHLHSEGLKVSVWTVDDPEQGRKFAEIGVDSLMTNDPKRIIKSLKAEA